MNNSDLDILKDKYAMGTLSADENASLQVEILNNPEIESDLKIRKDLVKGIQYAGELELKDMMDKIHYQNGNQKPGGKIKGSTIGIIAGLLLLLTVAGYYLLSNTSESKANPTMIYAEFYSQYQPSLQDRGASLDEAVSEFNEAYVRSEYQRALDAIKPYLTESSNEIKLTAAIAANEVNDLVLAEKLLDAIIAQNDYYFGDHALWYKALIKIKSNQLETVKDILTPIINNPKADHHDEAIALVAKLKG